MNAKDRALLVASLATVFAILTRNERLSLIAAVTGATFALLNARDLLRKAVG